VEVNTAKAEAELAFQLQVSEADPSILHVEKKTKNFSHEIMDFISNKVSNLL